MSPHGNYWIYCHTHGRFERGVQLLTVAIVDLSTGRTFMVGAFPYAVRKMLDLGMVAEFKTKIDLAREMLDVLKGYFRVSRVVFDSWYWSEKLVTDNVVSELKSNLAQGRVGPGDPRGGGGAPPSGRPTPRSLLRRPDHGKPSDYSEVASPGI